MSNALLLETLGTMHTYCRPHGGTTEAAFITRYVAPLPGATRDRFGNWHVSIGDSAILFSSHTDTVHHAEGMQGVGMIGDRMVLTDPPRLSRRARRRAARQLTFTTSRGCLGADDTVGVFLMREMILAGISGRYVFHYGEEAGCIGSRELADCRPDLVSRYSHAIAFDRMGTSDVISHQMGRRTASDLFTQALADRLNACGLKYAPCDRGLYTDTNSYEALIPECTNVAIGYSAAHSDDESVDTSHVFALRTALLEMSWDALPIDRVAGEEDPRDYRPASYFDWSIAEDDDDDATRAAALHFDDRTWDDDVYLNRDYGAIQRALREWIKR